MRKISCSFILLLFVLKLSAQLKWQNVDSLYQPLPSSVHIYFSNEPIDTVPFCAFYLIADLRDKKLDFTDDTTLNRRLTPSKFYEKDNKPLIIVNCTFFSFETNQNLNVVIKDGKTVAYNVQSVKGKGMDSFEYVYRFRSAIGINTQRKSDIAWIYTDSTKKYPLAMQLPICGGDWKQKGKMKEPKLKIASVKKMKGCLTDVMYNMPFEKKWKMQTAVGGGPVLLQGGEVKITNNEEMMFAGKAINDKHPRTAMGYTKEGKLIILVIQGRSESGGGASLPQEAQILKDLGCWEALNLDGGGSSCMLVNGKETIKPSDKEGERPVPAVFIIKQK